MGELVSAKCPECGASIQVDENREKFFCSYCGNQVLTKKSLETQQVTVSGPVQVTGEINTVDHEFEKKLALAKTWEKIYFGQGPNAVVIGDLKGYDAVLALYHQAEFAGAHHSKYWAAVASFYVRAHLEGFKTGYRVLFNAQEFINHYQFLMDNAIEYARPDEKGALEAEKEKTVQKLKVELSKVPVKKKGCYIATAVYGSYNCPEVWLLRRFRDQVLAERHLGRLFIRAYYRLSPACSNWFANGIFNELCRGLLDRVVIRLGKMGFSDCPYED